MAGQHGKDAVFKIAQAGNTLTDVSRATTSVTLDRSRATTDVTTFQPPGQSTEYIGGLRDGSMSANGYIDGSTNIDQILSDIDSSSDGLADFEHGPEGSASGNVKYTGQAILTSYSTPANVDGALEWSAEFQITGQITRSTY